MDTRTPLLLGRKKTFYPILLCWILAAGLAAAVAAAPPPSADEAPAAAKPLRVVLPVGHFTENFRDNPVGIPFLEDLRERLQTLPEITLLSEHWSHSLFAAAQAKAHPVDEKELFAFFTNSAPLDAVVQIPQGADGGTNFKVILHTREGVRRREFAIHGKNRGQEAVEAIGAWLAEEWRLPPSSARHLTGRRIKDPDGYPTVFGAWRMIASASDNADLNMARAVLPRLLGTEFEFETYAILRKSPATFVRDLLKLVTPLGSDSLELTLGDGKTDPGATADPSALNSSGVAMGPVTLEQRLGALRCLGVIKDQAALKIMNQCLLNPEPIQREAVATALQYYEGKAGLDLLEKLAGDQAPTVAFAAAFSQWKRGQDAPGLLPLARRFLDDAARFKPAYEAWAALATAEDVPRLQAYARHAREDVRVAAVHALVRLRAVVAADLPALLNDPSDEVEAIVLRNLPAELDAAARGRLRQLANAPASGLALAARLGLHAHRPSDPQVRLREEMTWEHPAIRMMLIDALATNREPWAIETLVQACDNADPHARARALRRLGEAAPERARPLLAKAITDPSHWVRLHAAAQIAGQATATEADAIRAAVAREADEAIGLYLADALAHAEGRPMPASRPAAYSIAGQTNLTWLCGMGTNCVTSPFQAYYSFSPSPNALAQRAHDKGKIIFARLGVINNHGAIITDPLAMDGFWLALQHQLTTNNLPYLDGLVLGDESLGSHQPSRGVGSLVFGAEALGSWQPPGSHLGWPDFCRTDQIDPVRVASTLWDSGWPVFCHAAGIDPVRVNGVQSNLAPREARAWNHWAECQAVNGFNVLYDYVKLRYGKLRPGLHVATFMPGRGGLSPNDREWKFDVGGICDWKGDNRIAAYTLIRRMKTLWPDRPVVWMSLGIGACYDNNPVKHTRETPSAPIAWREDRTYADSVSAWLAGADNGWISTWNFMSPTARVNSPHDIYHGSQLLLEDIVPNGERLKKALNSAFSRLGGLPKIKAGGKGGAPKVEIEPLERDDTTELSATDKEVVPDEKLTDNVPAPKWVMDAKEQMRVGFHFYGKYLYDCARVFASLPRLNPKPSVLAVRPGLSTKSPTDDFAAPGFNLLNAYDFLTDINQTPDADLARYRLIAVDGVEQIPLTDRTITALSGWLKDRPGLLYVHGFISTNTDNAVCTTQNFTGQLRERWPWAGQIGLVTTPAHYVVAGPNAKVLVQGTDGPSLVLWRGTGDRGVVLFDTGPREPSLLREEINRLAREEKVGVELTGPTRQMIWNEAGIQGAACGDGSISNMVQGVDLLTCASSPVVGPGRSGALTTTNLFGKYVASANGVVARCERPIQKAEPVAGGLRITCDGLIEAGSAGLVAVSVEGGRALPPVATGQFNDWVLFGSEEGISAPPPGKPGRIYLRSAHPVTITAVKP